MLLKSSYTFVLFNCTSFWKVSAFHCVVDHLGLFYCACWAPSILCDKHKWIRVIMSVIGHMCFHCNNIKMFAGSKWEFGNFPCVDPYKIQLEKSPNLTHGLTTSLSGYDYISLIKVKLQPWTEHIWQIFQEMFSVVTCRCGRLWSGQFCGTGPVPGRPWWDSSRCRRTRLCRLQSGSPRHLHCELIKWSRKYAGLHWSAPWGTEGEKTDRE